MANLKDAVNCGENLADRVPPILKNCAAKFTEFSEKISLANIEAKKNGQPIRIPVFAGHSMGGLIAQAMGAKFQRTSYVFNPLGIGDGVRNDFIGEENYNQANGNDGRSHVAIITAGDWVSDPRCASAKVLRPQLGTRIILPCLRDGKPESNEMHNAFSGNLQMFLSK
jgi:hypothetical protein